MPKAGLGGGICTCERPVIKESNSRWHGAISCGVSSTAAGCASDKTPQKIQLMHAAANFKLRISVLIDRNKYN